MPDIEVYCTVRNCRYWDDGNRCGAARILIASDSIDQRYLVNTDAQQVTMAIDQVGSTPAESYMETCCQTFQPRR